MLGCGFVDKAWICGLECPRAYAQALWWKEKGVGLCRLEAPSCLEDESKVERSRARFGERERLSTDDTVGTLEPAVLRLFN